MSSVLKALKKLEGIQPLEEDVMTLPQKITAKEAINKRVKGHWIFNRAISIMLIVVITAFGTWLLLSHGPFLAKEKTTVMSPPEPIKKGVKITPVPQESEKLQSDPIPEKPKSLHQSQRNHPKKRPQSPLP